METYPKGEAHPTMSLAPWRRFSIVSWTSVYLSVSLGLWLPPGVARSLSVPINAAETTGLTTLKNDIVTMSAGAGGILGVAAWRLDGKGPKVLLNPDERFPMASTVKVAVAGAVLSMVDAGRTDLSQMITVDPDSMVTPEIIARYFIHPGVAVSVYNLLELMLTESDNTATDLLVGLAGGPAAVNAWVNQQGVTRQRVDRNLATLIRDFRSLPEEPFSEAYAAVSKTAPTPEGRSNQNPTFDDDPRDTSTPTAMTTLIARVFAGDALSLQSTRVLTTMMLRCNTGPNRLAGRMPAQTLVAHKTGTLGRTANDVGVIELPMNVKIVVAIFIKKSTASLETREQVIADIARSIRDYFLYV